MFKKPFSFSGRIRRTEYAMTLLIYFVLIFGLQFLAVGISPGEDEVSWLFLFLYIPVLWLMLAQGAKRCHDRGNSGWFQLIPFYGFWMLLADSIHGVNSYGENPKGIGNVDEIDTIGDYLPK